MDIATVLLKNRYQIGERIGQGGMASVHRGLDTSLGREVAIKMFPAADADIEVIQQEAEVNVLAGLSHHSLVTLLDAGVDRTNREQPRIFLVMELMRGSDLQQTISAGLLSSRHIAYIGYDIAEGLQYIHHRGIVHRDIKPSNILLANYEDESTRPRAKLTDFGIAHNGPQSQPLDDPSTTGTAAYLSPEQVSRDQVGIASDIYSLGLVLIECFTGVLAYPGKPVESAMARLSADPPLPENISNDWKVLLAAMTARDPAKRPPATELVLALRDLVIADTGRHKDAADEDELERAEEIRRRRVADFTPDPAFDRITAMAARVLETPVALISIVGEDHLWFSSRQGVDLDSIAQIPGLCASAIDHDLPWVVEDASSDSRTKDKPLVTGDFGLRFIAGHPVLAADGVAVGSLCIVDFERRTLSPPESETLRDLAAMATAEIASRAVVRSSGAAAKHTLP